MYNISFVEENIENLKDSAEKKGINLDFEKFKKINDRRKLLKGEVDDMRRERNEKGKKVGALKREGRDAADIISELEELKEDLKDREKELRDVQSEVEDFISWLPNLIHPSVSENPEIIKGPKALKEFSFDILDHVELGEQLNILDFNAASRVAGAHFPLYRGQGAKYERALINFMLDVHTKRHGYTEIFPPFLANENSMFNTGQLPKMRDDMYMIDRDSFFLNPTAEVPLTNIHAGDILSPDELPVKYCGYTACFRREAGSYGSETQGLLRVHQFNKVELVLFSLPENSYDLLEVLLEEALKVIKILRLPYRVVKIPYNDLSFAAAKTYDIEIYAPATDRWLEVSSITNFEDFQATRANIRMKRGGSTEFVHTLNASGVATPRLMICLLENYQNEIGDIKVPAPLVPYTGFDTIYRN